MTKNDKENCSQELVVKAEFIQSDTADKLPDSSVYVFSEGGRFLSKTPIKENKDTKLNVPINPSGSLVRLLVGPELKEAKPELAELIRRGSEQRIQRIELSSRVPEIHIPVFPDNWLCWLKSLCLVKGKLVKRTILDGVSVDLPICNAVVDVYEVDYLPIIIDRLPNDLLESLRDMILGRPPKGPFPPEPFPPEPRPPGPLPPGPLAPESNFPNTRLSDAQKHEGDLSKVTNELEKVNEGGIASPQLQLMAANPDIQLFKKSLIQQFVQVKTYLIPMLCLILPFPVSKQKVATAKTDECGRFKTFFFKGCNNADTPDLYFIAKQELFGNFNLTIYEPKPVNCHTYWNYTCGTEVKLVTSSPFARTCSPCSPVIADNNWVLVRAIGNLPLSRIRGCSQDLSATTDNANSGLNMRLADDPLDFNGRPFGGTLRVRIEFDNSLREDLDVKYYRVYYRKGNSGVFNVLTGEVHRHYTHEVGDDLIEEPFSVGPKVVNGVANLFEIPPALPPEGQWSIPDIYEDIINAKFPTSSFVQGSEHGKYQLKIDLFDHNGVIVDINNIGGETIHYVIPADEDPSSPGPLYTDEADDLGLVLDDDGDGLKSFIMPLHIDNNVCTASINSPQLDGVVANECGVMQYLNTSNTVTIPFVASHPNGFASYSFNVKRGINILSALNQFGQATGVFNSVSPLNTMLSVNCPMAGYSAHLHVNAWATNGYAEINAYDRGDHIGFALSPVST